jgi:hypothetical protein
MSAHVVPLDQTCETRQTNADDKTACNEALECDLKIRALIQNKQVYDRRWLQQREMCFRANTDKTPWCRL